MFTLVFNCDWRILQDFNSFWLFLFEVLWSTHRTEPFFLNIFLSKFKFSEIFKLLHNSSGLVKYFLGVITIYVFDAVVISLKFIILRYGNFAISRGLQIKNCLEFCTNWAVGYEIILFWIWKDKLTVVVQPDSAARAGDVFLDSSEAAKLKRIIFDLDHTRIASFSVKVYLFFTTLLLVLPIHYNRMEIFAHIFIITLFRI